MPSHTMKTDRHTHTYRMPAEWEEHEAVWLQWPDVPMRESPSYARKLQSTWLEMTAIMADNVCVQIVATDEVAAENIENDCTRFGIRMDNVQVHILPIDDVWARDNGPIFVRIRDGGLAVTGWNFNCYGESGEFKRDARVPEEIARKLNIPFLNGDIVTEGGAIEVNGTGTLMATRSSIINPNRNPGKNESEIEKSLASLLGIDNFVWLTGASTEDCNKLGDGTDWHVDIAARFTDRSTVLACWTDDESDPRQPFLERHVSELEAATDEMGGPLTVIKIPSPHVRTVNGIEWTGFSANPGSMTDAAYTNYLVTNGLVLVPVYGQRQDEDAKSILAEQFPDRQIVGIPTLTLTEEGGAIHCVTQQQPVA
jgi:agmatine deiminase